jgi:hypothetical protein
MSRMKKNRINGRNPQQWITTPDFIFCILSIPSSCPKLVEHPRETASKPTASQKEDKNLKLDFKNELRNAAIS